MVEEPVRLHGYQRTAVEHLHRHPRAALYIAMGHGKSAIVLSALTPDHLPVLVCAPKRVVEYVWPQETAKWRPDLTISLAIGSPVQRATALQSDADIIVIGRDVLKDALPYADRFKTIVLDESSGFKTRNSVRWKTARKLLKDTPHVWELTGTPSPHGLMDLWAQLALLDGGERLGKSLTSFRSRYFRPGRQLANGVIAEWLLKDGADKHIQAAIEDICISMENRLDLPAVTFNEVVVPLPPATQKIYREMRDELVVHLDLLGETHMAANAAVLTSKLSQITAGFIYSDQMNGSYTDLHEEKVRALEEIIDGTGSPVLVFYQFKAERDMLPGVSIDEPNAIDRWNRGEIPVLLAHPASAGHGLNLQSGPGHTIVWATSPWSLELYQQGNARLARQGQQHPVVVHHLVAPSTVDGAILDRLAGKKSVQQALLDYLAAGVAVGQRSRVG